MEELEINNNIYDSNEMAEEDNMDKLLKGSVGGYTKKSVMEYVGILKRQYYNTEDSLNFKVQTLLDENQKLKEKLESNNKVLGDKVALGVVETQERNAGDIATYKAMIKALQQDVKELENKLFKSTTENSRLVEMWEEREKEISQKEHELQQMTETEAKKEKSADLSTAVTQLKDEILYYKEMVSNGKISELNTRIDELTAMVEAQNAIVEKRCQEIQTKDITIETVTAQNDLLNKTITTLTQNIDSIMVQNEKLSAVNKIITQKLAEAQKTIVDEIAEKSDIYIEKLILSRRLDEAQLKLNLHNEKSAGIKEDAGFLKFDEIKFK